MYRAKDEWHIRVNAGDSRRRERRSEIMRPLRKPDVGNRTRQLRTRDAEMK
jgi:hypothetical protein